MQAHRLLEQQVSRRALLTLSLALGGQSPRRLTQRELAAMAGTAREVAGRALKALEQQGAVRIERGHTVVADRGRLAILGRWFSLGSGWQVRVL